MYSSSIGAKCDIGAFTGLGFKEALDHRLLMVRSPMLLCFDAARGNAALTCFAPPALDIWLRRAGESLESKDGFLQNDCQNRAADRSTWGRTIFLDTAHTHNE